MVSRNALNRALLELLPEGIAVFCVPNGWVHLEPCALSLNIRLVKGEVLRERFRRDDGTLVISG